MFKVYGDNEIWQLQLTALKKLLSDEHFEPKRKKQAEVVEEEVETIEPENRFDEDMIDFSNLPQMDLSDIGPEFKVLTDHFIALRSKYPTTKKVLFDKHTKKE